MAILYIIQGFIASGKTAFSKQLADQTKAVRLNADEWVENAFPPERYNTQWDECFSEAVTAIWKKTEDLLQENKDVILDLGFWTKQSRNDARNKSKDFGAELIHFYLEAPEPLLLERLQNRSGPIAQRNIENFHLLKKEFHKPDEEENPIIVRDGTLINLHAFMPS